MASQRNQLTGFINWADNPSEPRPTNGHTNGHAAPVERITDAERRAITAEARLAALESERERLASALREQQVATERERAAREQCERAQRGAERLLSEAREEIWRWLAQLARTPFWRLRRAVSEPPVQLKRQSRLAPPED